ncbi:low affinity immunoglobulin epsilon Fc receptor [Eubalaena glacialis]|uniref:low affinity immunoglobulin epsilon Fc receptor n=1 Tax=Eubalaena glacialis TaxID=27606 RepID=UPI002A5998E7|nr:low affinity immunoglobulin epsilon Fc receptor [Eubalaena glacialis]
MEETSYSEFLKFHRRQRQCCRRGIQLVLLGLVIAALWAGLLTLLLLWHWETARNLKQLEEATAQKVSQVSKDLERHKGDQMAQKSQAAQMLQDMERIQAEQKRMESQESELSRNLDGLRADLSNLKSHSLNERREALDSLGRLQEEVGKLWMEIRESIGSVCNICPEEWVYFQKKCYYFGEGTKKWIQARYACSKLHGRLVSIRSQEEQDFLTKHSNKRASWIGLRDLDIEGEFIWMDSSPLGYSNWQPGEPNDAGQGENCVMMQGSGQWNDVFCGSYLNSWVCDRLATC